jgi:hypothetical protein
MFIASSYASSKNEISFLSYFASTTPDSEHKRTRLKAIVFLQGSSLYDVKAVHSKLEEYSKLLPLETAILEGRVSCAVISHPTEEYSNDMLSIAGQTSRSVNHASSHPA